jgi:hypothetical protein
VAASDAFHTLKRLFWRVFGFNHRFEFAHRFADRDFRRIATREGDIIQHIALG